MKIGIFQPLMELEGYFHSISKNTLDEAPQAYKDSMEIEKLIMPTADIIDRLKPVLNIKSS